MTMQLIFSSLMLLVFQNIVNCSSNVSEDDYSDYNANIYKKYVIMDKQLKGIAEQSVKRVIPYLLEASEHVNISARCTRNLFDLINGFRKLTNWSFNFLDAMGKIQSGLKTGNVQMFGEYEECIETAVMKRGKVDFQGQYCSISCKPFLPKVKKTPSLNGRLEGLVNATRNSSDWMKLIVSRAHSFYGSSIKIGVCVPSGCSKQDISEIVNYTLGEYVDTKITHCLKKGDIYYWTITRTIGVSMMVSLGLIVIISTLLDNTLKSWKNNKLGFKSRIFQCYSLTRNFPKLMNTDVPQNSITCLHGIRVLTIFWIILGHEYFMHSVTLTGNHLLNYQLMLPKFFSQIALNGFVSVEVFFFISGFVNCYSRMLIKQEGKSQPGFFRIVLHRLWRIYPAYFAAFLLMNLLSKPQPNLYHQQMEFQRHCQVNWWQNVLLINNLFTPFTACLPHTWYLCADWQLFLLTLFTIPVLLRKPKKGIILHVVIILIVNLGSMAWWLVDDIPPSTLDGTRLDLRGAMKSYKIYNLPVVHTGPYFIGIILGYIIATKKEIKIPKKTQVFGWLTASLFFISMVFMTLRWNSGLPYTPLESSLYGAWSRTILILGFSWLVLSCVTGHAGLINYILSLKLWIPLSRITYMIYLVSPLIQITYHFSASFPDDFSDMRIIWNYFADVSISILMSFALVMIVESPAIAMEKVIFRRNEDRKPEVPKELTSSNVKEYGLSENGKITTIHI